jgi:hypothetical protein
MFNEAELMIIKENVVCPECSAKGGSKVSYTTTLAAGHSFEDTNGHFHDHNTNTVQGDCSCKNGHRWSIRLFNSCWCGWTQSPQHPFGEKVDGIEEKQDAHGTSYWTSITEKDDGEIAVNVQSFYRNWG